MSDSSSPRLGWQLAVLTVSRLVLNTGLRMAYPFLPAFARGLEVSLPAIASLVSLRGFAGLLSPLFGPLSERYGRRPVVTGALLFAAVGSVVVLLRPSFWTFGLALTVIALAKVIYDPAMQAYLGDTVAYARRGRALAITELSWAGAFLLGVPALGFVIQRQGWQAPFLCLALAAVGAALLLRRSLPTNDGRSGQIVDLRTTAAVIRREPVIWAAAVYIMLVMGANELVLIVYGDWMEQNFALSLTNLGLATGVIGGAEVSGELLVGVSVDRFGKRPVIILTGFLTALMHLAIPFTSATLMTALISLFALFLFFEMTVVGGIPLMTEIVPHARGVVMSIVLAAGGLGRALGALLGPAIWLGGGFTVLGLTAGLMVLVGVLVLARWVREGNNPLDRQSPEA